MTALILPISRVFASPALPAPADAASPPPSAPGSGAGLERPAPGGGAAPAAPAYACRSGAPPPPAAPDGNCATARHRPRHDGHAVTTLEHTGRLLLLFLLLLLLLGIWHLFYSPPDQRWANVVCVFMRKGCALLWRLFPITIKCRPSGKSILPKMLKR